MDCHCHLGVTASSDSVRQLRQILKEDSVFVHSVFYLMTTYYGDFELTRRHLIDLPQIVPFFGIHPWYSHLYYTEEHASIGDTTERKRAHYHSVLNPAPSDELLHALPEPRLLNDQIESFQDSIADFRRRYPDRHCGVGEIGLDKVFRVPMGLLGSTEEKLSPNTVRIDHQVAVYEAMIKLAQRSQVPVSVHCVKAHGKLFEVTTEKARNKLLSKRALQRLAQLNLEPPATIKEIPVILHSWSGLEDQVKMWLKYPGIFFSLSNWINGQTLVAWARLCQVLPELDFGIDKWLIEKPDQYHDNMREIVSKLDAISHSEDKIAATVNQLWAL